MKSNTFKGRSKRTKLFTAITAVGITFVIVLNLLLAYFGGLNNLYFDMTREGLYTVSSAMKNECRTIFDALKEKGDEKVHITFCTDPDYLMGARTTRLPYLMVQELANLYPDSIRLVRENVINDPTSVAQYKATSLTEINTDDIIVSYGGRYLILSAERFWETGTSQSVYYNGEYTLATLIRSVTAVDQPVAYFVTGHQETVYNPDDVESESSRKMAEFADLLMNRGLNVKVLDLSSVDRIPDDCVLLIINNPREDFKYDESKLNQLSYVTDLEKIDRYLVMKQGAVMVAKDHSIRLKNFENFLAEWGFSFGDYLVKDEVNSLQDAANTNSTIIASYDKDEDSYGYTIYGEFADLSSAPITVFENTGSISCSFRNTTSVGEAGNDRATKNYVPFLTTSDKAKLYGKNPVTGEYTSVAGKEGVYDLAALTVRSEMDSFSGKRTNSYLFCVNSPDFFQSAYLKTSSYANYEILSALVENISRIDERASIDLGGTSLNSLSGGGKKLIHTNMSESGEKIYSNKYINNDKKLGFVVIKSTDPITDGVKIALAVLFALVPVSIAVTGVVVCVKRRYL